MGNNRNKHLHTVYACSFNHTLHYITCDLLHLYSLKRRRCDMSLRKGMPFYVPFFFFSAVLK